MRLVLKAQHNNMNSILPTSLIADSIIAVFLYIMPQYTDLNSKRESRQEYSIAIEEIAKVQKTYAEAREARSTIRQGDLNRIDTIISDSFDNVQFLLELNRITVQKGVSLGTVDIKKKNDENSYATYEVSFSFEAPFNGNIDSFMSSVETSLVLLDVQKLTMKSLENGLIAYDLAFNTYAKK